MYAATNEVAAACRPTLDMFGLTLHIQPTCVCLADLTFEAVYVLTSNVAVA